jgi:FtsP/CotA-like multicopper oxidase with cupredoxin domain
MPAQNPYNPDLTGINMLGRWMYGPWFFPPTPVCGSSPQAVAPYCINHGAVPNEYYNPACDPALGFCQPPERPGTPNPSWGAEAFLDTMVVNGAAYPTTTVTPGKYRLRILNASHDRFLNLQFYRAVSKTGYANPTVAPYDFVGTGPTDLTEVAMVPAAANTVGFPATWPTDGREGGVPDPATRGPAFIQIGTEGGVLPAPALLPNQPVQWNQDPTMFNFGNVLNQRDGGGTLFLAPAERADVIVDFTNFAGQTLILYNDAPTAFPALVPQYDYYTGAPDRTDIGGYGPVLPGLGPNIRTVMQIVVSGTGGTAPPDDYDAAFLSTLTTNFTSPAGIFASTQHPIVVGQTAYNSNYSTTFPATWPNWGISRIADDALSFQTVNPDLTIDSTTFASPNSKTMERKAIHDEMGATFDDYGRMSAKLGLEVPFANAATQNFILQNFVDPVTELVKPDEVQIWRITHNGVDTHPIHFHLFDVQLLNRVGWDGFMRLPDDNELGWKDTLRVSPLEDTIVALRPVKPSVPFKLPNSLRPLNPTTPIGDTMGFSQVNITNGGALTPLMRNKLVNLGWEYTWHCHILSHEENDMMRVTSLVVAPEAPTNLAAVLTGTGVNKTAVLTWRDNSLAETRHTIQRAANSSFTGTLKTFVTGRNVKTYSDVIGDTNRTYYYRVFATNIVGGTIAGTPLTSYSTASSDSGFSNVAGVNLPPSAPTNVSAAAFRFDATYDRVTVTWTDTSNNETSFRIQRATDAAFQNIAGTGRADANTQTYTTGNMSRNVTNYFRVQAYNASGSSAWVNATNNPITTP